LKDGRLDKARSNLATLQSVANKLSPVQKSVVEAKSAMLLMRAESLSSIETLAFALASAEMLVRHLEMKGV
jgi:hypothetical protein